MASEILKITKIDVCLLGILIVSLAYQVRKSLNCLLFVIGDAIASRLELSKKRLIP